MTDGGSTARPQVEIGDPRGAPSLWLTQSRLVILLGVLVSLLTMCFAGFQAYSERERNLQLWRESAEAESSALAAHALQTLTAADLVLRSIIERSADTQVTTVEQMREALGSQEVHTMLRARPSGVPQVSVASIVDVNGDMVNFTRNHPPRSNSGERINLKERDYFQAHLNDPQLDLFLSKPVENKGNGTWTFYLARKLRAPDGAMLGVVLAGLESAYFQDFYKELATPGKAYSMFHTNGANLARWPAADGVVGGNFASSAIFRLVREGARSATLQPGEQGVATGTSSEMRIVAPTAVKNYPVVVSVRVSGSMVLASWRRSVFSTLTLAFGLTIVTGLMTIAVLRLLRRNAQVIADLETARAQSDVATRAKTDFLATMSHEIRTPMNAVVGLISLMWRTKLDPEQKRLLRVVSDSADGLLNVVNDVLDFSRLDSGKQTMAMESFSVASLVESAISVARAYPGAAKLTLTGEVAADVPPFLIGDRGALSRMLLNLLHNAVKFTAEGSVRLIVRLDPQPSGDPWISFAVRDSGSGVPAALQDKIFEPFEQASNGRLSPHHGTGLGLAICGRISASMGGKLTLESEEGVGSAFISRLPLKPGEPMEEPVATVKQAARIAGDRLRVLVAEDTPASQMVIRLMLENLGHDVRLVSDGAQAFQAFREERFDLVFLDVQMPVMNGYEAARLIRAAIADSRKARPADPPSRLVGLSAFAQTADRKAALDAGMDDYLPKPIRASDLGALMDRLAFGPQTPVEPSAESGVAAVDDGLLEEFLEVVGPSEFAEAVSTFERDADAVVTRLASLLASKDDPGVKQAAHRLKGVFGQFGASDAAALAADVERARPLDRADLASRLLDAAPEAIAMVMARSRTLLKQVETTA